MTFLQGIWVTESELRNVKTMRTGARIQTGRQKSHAARGDGEEAVWPEFNNALVCHTWTEFVGQISVEEQRDCKRGRRERQRCAGQTDSLLLITRARLHMGMKDIRNVRRGNGGKKTNKNEGRGHSNSAFHFFSTHAFCNGPLGKGCTYNK